MSHDLTLTRTMAARPALVWRCMTEPDLLKHWFAPAPVTTTEAEIDLAPGGIFRTVMEVPEHGTMAGDAGCILLVEPERRLVWTSALGPAFRPNPVPDGGWTFTADITLSPVEAGCTYAVTLRHATPEAATAHDAMGFEAGWGTAAEQLETLAKSL